MRPGERTVTLADGREASNYSDEWRAECIAREVLAMPREQRLAFYRKWAERHGRAAAESLRADVTRIYKEATP